MNIGKESSAFYVEPLEDKNAPKEREVPATPVEVPVTAEVTAETEQTPVLARSI